MCADARAMSWRLTWALCAVVATPLIACSSEPGSSDDNYATQGTWGKALHVGSAPGHDNVDHERATLAVDAQGVAHIAFVDDNTHLGYAAVDNGTMTTTVVDSGVAEVGEHAEIATGGGLIHIAYTDRTNHALKYASSSDGTNWTVTTATAEYGFPSDTEMVIDESGVRHVAFSSYDRGVVYATSDDGATWATALVADASQPTVGGLTVDARGAHISYWGYASEQLHYVLVQPGGGVARETLPAHARYQSDIAVDTQGAVHVTYADKLSDNDMVIQHVVRQADGSWSEPVQAAVGYRHALAVDGSGNLHLGISTNWSTLRYAARGPDGQWREEYFGGSGSSHSMPSLSVDATGRPHMVYRSGFPGQFKYTKRTQ